MISLWLVGCGAAPDAGGTHATAALAPAGGRTSAQAPQQAATAQLPVADAPYLAVLASGRIRLAPAPLAELEATAARLALRCGSSGGRWQPLWHSCMCPAKKAFDLADGCVAQLPLLSVDPSCQGLWADRPPRCLRHLRRGNISFTLSVNTGRQRLRSLAAQLDAHDPPQALQAPTQHLHAAQSIELHYNDNTKQNLPMWLRYLGDEVPAYASAYVLAYAGAYPRAAQLRACTSLLADVQPHKEAKQTCRCLFAAAALAVADGHKENDAATQSDRTAADDDAQPLGSAGKLLQAPLLKGGFWQRLEAPLPPPHGKTWRQLDIAHDIVLLRQLCRQAGSHTLCMLLGPTGTPEAWRLRDALGTWRFFATTQVLASRRGQTAQALPP